jgi:tRNA (uracil-5-)-methyltransferase
MPYEEQLAHKKRTVELAYKRFSQLTPDQTPSVLDTIPSPKQWGYRTKITPHFEGPPRWAKAIHNMRPNRRGGFGIKKSTIDQGEEEEEALNAGLVAPDEEEERLFKVGEEWTNDEGKKWELKIGFDRKCGPGTLDIEVNRLYMRRFKLIAV